MKYERLLTMWWKQDRSPTACPTATNLSLSSRMPGVPPENLQSGNRQELQGIEPVLPVNL